MENVWNRTYPKNNNPVQMDLYFIKYEKWLFRKFGKCGISVSNGSYVIANV